jgi:hypothetical protein
LSVKLMFFAVPKDSGDTTYRVSHVAESDALDFI